MLVRPAVTSVDAHDAEERFVVLEEDHVVLVGALFREWPVFAHVGRVVDRLL